MLYHAGPSSLVFFAECLNIITDSNLHIQSYKNQVQLKPKLHVVPPLVIAFWTSITVFGVFCCFHFGIKSRATCRLKSRCQSDLSTVSVLAKKSLHQDLMHSGCRGTVVPNVCLQAFSLVPLPSFPLDQRPVHSLFWMSLYKGFLAYFVYLYRESPEVVRGDQVCLYFVEKGNLKFSDPNMEWTEESEKFLLS